MGRNHTTLADYMVLAISPALIMAMIGAFVFFLIEVFYAGQFETRLLFICSMFILGAVMIGRLSMTEGAGYASLFAVPLGFLTAIAMIRFVPYSGSLAAVGFVMNVLLLAIIWYSAHKLTWSCTFIENSQDASSQGLLQSLGMSTSEDDTPLSQAEDGAESTVKEEGESGLTGAAPTADNPLQPWLDWFERTRKKPQKPGAWIVYFSLIALPLFGLGQWSIDYADMASRRYVFWLLCLFVAAALSLLATTSFLGLRRYLRHRGVEMPVDIAGLWLGLGGALIVVVLFVAWLFPRPSLEYSIAQVDFSSKDQDYTTSEYAPGDDGVKYEPDGTSTGKDEHAEPEAGTGSSDVEAKEGSDAAEKAHQEKESRAKDGKPGEGKGKSKGEGKKPGDDSGGGDSKSEKADKPSKTESGDKPKDSAGGSSREESKTKPPEKNSESNSKPPPSSETAQTPSASQRLSQAAAWIGQLLKWGFYLLLAGVVAFFAWRNRETIVAAWQQLMIELRELWARWMGGRNGAEDVAEVQQPSVTPPQAFSSFISPFHAGAAQQNTDQIVTYTFQALEAWGREQGCSREAGETPAEFAGRLGQQVPPIGKEARHLASLYSRVAYGGGGLAKQNLLRVESLWQLMSQHLAPPVAV